MAGIYFHIPFCKQLCSYCDFHFHVSLERKEEMAVALGHELEKRAEFLSGEEVRTIYFGGGTPTVYEPEYLQQLVEDVKRIFHSNEFEEITVEANPDDLTDEYLRRLSQTDVSRLSLGIQSFDDTVLRFFNRRHTGKEGYEAVLRAKKYFANITADLIYGIPGMDDRKWKSNLDRMIGLDLPHLSAYHLTIEERTVFGKQYKRGLIQPVEDSVSESHYRILEELTADAGYDHYEISNFARSGFKAIHNSNYWTGSHYMGIGPSAHSYNGKSRRWNVANNNLYLDRLFSGKYYEEEFLTQKDLANEYILTSLRTKKGLDLNVLEKKTSEVQLFDFNNRAIEMIDKGLLVKQRTHIFIPTSFFLVSDSIISSLFVL